MAVKNYKLCVCYDGSRYKGWQKQGNTDNTIQSKLETLLSRLLSQNIELAGSGRTDAGVHAREQVCSFKADCSMETEELLKLIRRYLPEDIGAISLAYAPPRFHARLSCRGKTYVYRIWNSSLPNVFSRRYMLTYPGQLNIEAMEKAASYLIGVHDFKAFTSNKHMKKSSVRELKKITITQNGPEIEIALNGSGFLYNMVRIIVGTLLEAGAGKREPESVLYALNSLDRENAGETAPAHGLFLWLVEY